MNARVLVLLKSKTVWGAVCSAGGWLSNQPKIGVGELLQAGGMVLSAAGVRDAIGQAFARRAP